MRLRWSAVVSLTLALGVACGGRSEYFYDYGGEGDDESGGSGSGQGGTSGVGKGGTGKGGVGKGGVGQGGTGKGGTGFGGDFPTGGTAVGGNFPTGGTFPTGGAPTGGVGGVSGFGGTIPMGGVFPTGGVPTGGVSGVGGTVIVGGAGGSSAGKGGTSSGGTSGKGGSNTGGFAGSTPSNCLDCISQSCPDATACFQNQACVEGIFCGASSCGGLDGRLALRCWVACFNGDTGVALQALTAAACLASRCSVACQGFGQ